MEERDLLRITDLGEKARVSFKSESPLDAAKLITTFLDLIAEEPAFSLIIDTAYEAAHGILKLGDEKDTDHQANLNS